MGNVGEKCNCFGGKGDKNTFVFEEVDRITPVNKNFNESVSVEGSQKSRSVFNIALDVKDEDTFKKIVKIQKNVKSFLMKIKFKSTLRKKYLYDTLSLLEKYSNEFRTVNLYKAESYKNSAYDPLGWKNFYKHDDKFFNYNFGKVYNCKLLVSKDKSSIYSGQVNINNQMHGYGVLLTKEGVKYEGAWFNDKFNCWGKLIDQKGSNFQGKFENGKLNGFGSKMTIDNCHYLGEFKNSLKEGFGYEENHEHKYEGEFRNDKKEGKGKLTYKTNNDVYEGEFSGNNITGTGYYIWSNGDTFQGTFLNGKMEGKGLYKWPDGGEYYGEYKNNIKEGIGKFKWSNGKTFEGPFVNGKPHGFGKLYINDTPYDVQFKEGKLMHSKDKNSSLKSSEISAKKNANASSLSKLSRSKNNS